MTRARPGMLWPPDQTALLAAAVARARAGRRTIVQISGEPGVGKTSLLGELTAQAADFTVVSAEGFESNRAPFVTLTQWGIDHPAHSIEWQPSTIQAAEALRDLIDAVPGPLLLTIDDLHWADPESLAAIMWLLRRNADNTLLVAATTRPLGAEHADWQRWLARSGDATLITLTGLDRERAAQLIRRRWASADDLAVDRLWQHTGGNPLYLDSLVRDYSRSDLTALRLPAPSAFLQTVTTDLKQTSDSAVALADALAVLNLGWTSIPLLADVADLSQPEAAADELLAADLLSVRTIDDRPVIRFKHALIGSAIYQLMSLSRRRQLHERAARVVPDADAALLHRVAAATRYDDVLAQDLERHSESLYARGAFRMAAQFQDWADAATGAPRLRHQRQMTAAFYRAIARDFDGVRERLGALPATSPDPPLALVVVAVAAGGRRWADGVAAAEPWTRLPAGELDPLIRFRLEILLAWCRIGTDADTELLAQGLARAGATGVADRALSAMEMTVRGLVRARLRGVEASLGDLEATLAERVSEVPLDRTGGLTNRGILRALSGQPQPAINDLSEVLRRVQNGTVVHGAPTGRALLGLAYWLAGDWGQARVALRTAADLSPGHPWILALLPLVDSVAGRFDEAEQAIGAAANAQQDWRWREGSDLLFFAQVMHAHARGDRDCRRALLDGSRYSTAQLDPIVQRGPLLAVSVGLAAVWAGLLELADTCLEALRSSALPWTGPASHWLSGLIRESRRDLTGAADQLRSACEHGPWIRLFQGHALIDAGRVVARLDPHSATELADRGRQIYSALGAAAYTDRILAPPAGPPASRFLLSERERDILTLLQRGLSYAQIAGELYITQKTVSYHLGRLYTKVGVRSRHELTKLSMDSPELFDGT